MLKKYKELLARGNAVLDIIKARILEDRPYGVLAMHYIACTKETLEYIAEIEKKIEGHPEILPGDLDLPQTKRDLEERIELAYKFSCFDTKDKTLH